MSAPQSQAQLHGDVIKVVHAAANGWAVFDLKEQPSGHEARVTGVAPGVSAGEQITAVGAWVDTRWGRQFRSAEIRVSPPATIRGLRAFLTSGAIGGLGDTYADKLLARFGDDLIRILDETPGRLKEVAGIGPKRCQRIASAWQEHRNSRDILMFLGGHGLTPFKARRILEHFGDQTLAIVRGQPYRLIEIDGFGFPTADSIALQLGVPRDDPQRLRAGLLHTLDTAALYGHCALPPERLLAQGAQLLHCTRDALLPALAALSAEGCVRERAFAGETLIFAARLDRAETAISDWVRARVAAPPPWRCLAPAELDAAISAAEQHCGLCLSPSQRAAVAVSLQHGFSLITGGPGCGKTTTTRVIVTALAQLGVEMALAAPTGRAAKRLSLATGMPASTVHRLILKQQQPDTGLLTAEVVLLDEASMVDVELMVWLLDALEPTAAVILVGDADQLPSVGPGRVFGDLLDSGVVPMATLREIHRQAAHAICAGRVPARTVSRDYLPLALADREEIGERIEHLVCDLLPQAYGFHPLRQIQVLSPMKRGPAGTLALNARLQRRLNPQVAGGVVWDDRLLAPGDKVIATTNNYDTEIFNGDAGFVYAIEPQTETLIVDFDGRRVSYSKRDAASLLLAYALTVHKSQGAEYDAVVIALAREHYTLLSRALLYTAITRGKRFGAIVYEDGALELGINSHKEPRLTALRHRCGGG